MRVQALLYRLGRTSVKTKTIFLLLIFTAYIMTVHLLVPSVHRSPLSLSQSLDQLSRQGRPPRDGTMGSRPVRVSGFEITEVKEEPLTYHDMTSLTDKQTQRHQLVMQGCQGQEKELFGLSSDKWAYERIEINKDIPTVYCPLLKVGSTFWRRVFYAYRNNLKIHTPFDISIGNALSSKRDTLNELLPLHQESTQKILNESVNFMFVREPFTRLLSGYIDKIFSPNPYFWSVIGKFIVKNYRKNATQHSLRCGHDVTFSEFIQYVIDTEQHNKTERDGHFTPSYDQCKPCQVKYNTIGKMESFGEDTAYVLHRMGYNVSINSLKHWARKAEEDAVVDSTYSPFSWKKHIRKCISFHEAAKRIWHKLQIRGIVRKDRKMPFSEKDVDKIPAKRVVAAALQAGGSPSERGFLKKQKSDALRGSYMQVSASDIDKIRTLYKPDFELFGYSLHPDWLSSTENTDSSIAWLYNLSSV